ncbi:hypothetical protein VMCG_03384 [Cytospora schulzeri]|uniref:Uncharacterized protein n=1 Tax=Cytospora schulzeri TaxID=448051 RepID=A0A423WWA5_9PEZI|nr:hypothetical protein VMCG_03384 [Valsa malicola]
MAANDDADAKLSSSSPEDLKRDLAAELDKIGNNRKTADEDALRNVLRRWLENRSDQSPRALLYPVKGDPSRIGYGSKYNPHYYREGEEEAKQQDPEDFTQQAGFETLDKRGRAVVKLLRELARDEDFEVFLTQVSGACNSPEGDNTILGSSCRDYLDITGRLLFSNFVFPAENVLRTAHTDCEVAIAIVPSPHLLDELMKKTEDDDPRIKNMCYYLQRTSPQLPSALYHCYKEYTDSNMLGKFEPWDWPAQIIESWLMISLYCKMGSLFNSAAGFYPAEPPSLFFAQLSFLFDLSGQRENMVDYADGLDSLLGNVSAENIVDALWQLERPEDVAKNPHGYVATWIDRYLDDLGVGDEDGYLDLEEAKVSVGLCAYFQQGFDRGLQLASIFCQREGNSRLCLGLVLQIFENMECGDISAETAKSWYSSYSFTMEDIHILEITGAVNDPRCNVKTGRFIDCDGTMKRKDVRPFETDDISRMFSEMVNRGWHEEADEFLTMFVLRTLEYNQCHDLSPGYLFHKLWLPFFSRALNLYRDGDRPEWQRMDPIFGNGLLGVVAIYMVGVIGREPEKNTLRRAALRGTCHCSSCKVINGFLLNRRRTRQIFKVVESQGGRRSPSGPDFHVSRSALQHITRQLGHADRDCAFHVHETTAAGPVLVLQKRDNQWEWEKWNKRREEGSNELMQVMGTKYFQDIVGCQEQYEEWKELKFLKRGASKLKIPFVLAHPEWDINTQLREVVEMAAKMLSLVTRAKACLFNKQIGDEPEVFTMWWKD